jgi:hypothetical protein
MPFTRRNLIINAVIELHSARSTYMYNHLTHLSSRATPSSPLNHAHQHVTHRTIRESQVPKDQDCHQSMPHDSLHLAHLTVPTKPPHYKSKHSLKFYTAVATTYIYLLQAHQSPARTALSVRKQPRIGGQVLSRWQDPGSATNTSYDGMHIGGAKPRKRIHCVYNLGGKVWKAGVPNCHGVWRRSGGGVEGVW